LGKGKPGLYVSFAYQGVFKQFIGKDYSDIISPGMLFPGHA